MRVVRGCGGGSNIMASWWGREQGWEDEGGKVATAVVERDLRG